jgi:hypothetical protein
MSTSDYDENVKIAAREAVVVAEAVQVCPPKGVWLLSSPPLPEADRHVKSAFITPPILAPRLTRSSSSWSSCSGIPPSIPMKASSRASFEG